MGVDLRYHLVSLIAVFLSLGLGILVGSALVPNTVLIDRQNRMISRLEKDFAKIRQENKIVDRQNKIHLEFQKEVKSFLIKNKLKNTKVLIIKSSENLSDSFCFSLVNLLNESGAEQVSYLIMKDRLGLYNLAVKKEIFHHLGIKSKDLDKIILGLSMRIANEIIEGRSYSLLSYLSEKGVVQIKNYTPSCDYKIIFLTSKDNFLTITLPMVKIFREKQMFITGVETTFSKDSLIKEYKKENIPTVDNIDTIPGEISLVYVLQGFKGNYGIKNTADSILPKVSQ